MSTQAELPFAAEAPAPDLTISGPVAQLFGTRNQRRHVSTEVLGQVADGGEVEQRINNPKVGGSNPSGASISAPDITFTREGDWFWARPVTLKSGYVTVAGSASKLSFDDAARLLRRMLAA